MLITDKSQFPTFEDALMPILQTYGDGQERLLKNAKQEVYKKFFSNYSLEVHSSNKTVPTILDRIDRSHYYLYAGKYLDKIGYGKYKISQKGLDYLKTGKVLTHKYLSNEDEDFKNSKFHNGSNGEKEDSLINGGQLQSQEMTPQDKFDEAYKQIEAPKKEELLQKCRDVDPFAFEKIVGNLCEAMGYGSFIETPKSHDGGIDGIIKGDSLGFEKIYIQAKRYAEGNSVHGKEMQNFVGALAQTSVKRGIFFTTSRFDDNAIKTAENASKSGKDIILIDGEELVNLMFKYNVGVQTRVSYEIKDIDEDFFDNFS